MAVKSGKIKLQSTLEPLQKIKDSFNSKLNLLQVITPTLSENNIPIHHDLELIASKKIKTENATIFQAVLEFLHGENPDLICVIRRKRGFFKKLWEEDVVKKVDFESKIPLLVLKGKQ